MNKENKEQQKDEESKENPLEVKENISSIEDANIIADEKEEVKNNKLEIKSDLSENSKLAALDNFKTVGEMFNYVEVLIRSGFLPKAFKRPEQVITVIQTGRELGFGALTSINNIYNIQNRPTLSIHAIGALLKKAGIKYKIIKDFEDLFRYDDKDTTKVIGKTKVTTIRFYEKFGNQVIENDISYTWGEAEKAGLIYKDNWVKMPKLMLRTRCLAIGARFVAPDALLGLYETSEAAEFSNEDIRLDEDGNIINK